MSFWKPFSPPTLREANTRIFITGGFGFNGRIIISNLFDRNQCVSTVAPSGTLVPNMETRNHPMEAAQDGQVRSANPPAARHNASKHTLRAQTEQFPGDP